MNKIIMKIKQMELNSNQLKIIAIVTMLIDHMGYYFEPYMSNITYNILRAIGRISMPIFAFLITQGFFHTSNLKKYMLRVFIVAIVTQILIFMVSLFDNDPYSMSVNKELNVLFSYTLSLIILWIIHEKKIINRFNIDKNLLLKIILILLILGIFLFIPFDYGIYIPLLILMFYLIERLRISIYLQKQTYTVSMKKIFASFISEKHIKLGYIALITIALLLIIIESKNYMYWYMLFSIVPIYLYSGERGSKNKKLNYIFYGIFPVQHFLLYLLSII